MYPGAALPPAGTEATAALFTRILTDSPATGSWPTLADLRRAVGYQARASLPIQDALFPASSRP